MSKLNLAELGHWLKVTQLVGRRAVFYLWEPAFPHASYCTDVKDPMDLRGTGDTPFHTEDQWGEQEAPVMAGVRVPARCLCSPVFYFSLFIFWLWTGTWVRIRSGLDAFYWFLIFHISSWCMDVFSWAGAIAVGLSSCIYIFLLSPQHRLGLQLLLCSPGISFCHLTPSIVQHEFPSASLYLYHFLYYQLPAFFLKGYLGNSRPCVSWLVQRLSPKYLCILGISVCAPYPSIEENTSFSSLSIWIS